MKAIVLILIGVVSTTVHAGELDEIKKVPMKAVDTLVLVDKGQAPLKQIRYRFIAGSKRTIKMTSTKTVRAHMLGESQEAPQVDGNEAITYEAKSVAPDGTMTILLSNSSGAALFEFTAQGKARVKVDADAKLDEDVAATVARINATPMAFPAEPVGVGARWQMFSRTDMQGSMTDVVTVATITKIDGDKVWIHMVQDFRLDVPALIGKMQVPNFKTERGNQNNIADLVLDLSSPALISHGRMITVMDIKGSSNGRQVELEFVQRTAMDDKSPPAPANPKNLVGTWTRTWKGVTESMVYRADGTGDGVTIRFKWRVENETLMAVVQGIEDSGELASDMMLLGDHLVLQRPGGRQQLWKRR